MKKLHLISNAHLDPIWQWEWEEGAASALSTFRCAARFCREFEGYIFCHNEALIYRWVEEYEPTLFAEIQELVRLGKWHIMGGWHVQPDCNMPSGEGFARQITEGRRYFSEKFGVEPTTAINFDPFGHTRGLVQILARSGYDSYLFCRPDPGNCPLEAETFRWVGYDGSCVIGQRAAEGYSSAMGRAMDKIRSLEKRDVGQGLGFVLWGVGNHGGGPSREDIRAINEYIEDCARKGVEVLHSTTEAYFADVKAFGVTLPEHRGDLNMWAPGCYTSQVRLKQRYRQTENMLFSTEKMYSHLLGLGRCAYPEEQLGEVLYDMLTVQFHDVLPGSSVQPAEEMALRMMDHALEILSRLRLKAFLALSEGEPEAADGEIPVLVYNPHPYPVTEDITCEFMLADQNWSGTFHEPVVYREGVRLPSQCEKENSNIPLDWRKRVVFRAELAPMAMNRFDCRIEVREKKPVGDPVALFGDDPERMLFVTPHMVVEINRQTGLIDALTAGGRSYLGKDSCSIEVMQDRHDAWGMTFRGWTDRIGRFTLLSEEEGSRFSDQDVPIPSIRVLEDGPVRTVVEAVFGYEGSRARVRYKLSKQAPVLDVEVRLVNQEKRKLFKLGLTPTNPHVTPVLEVAFGEEPMKGDGVENVGQKYLAVSSPDGGCLNVLNRGCYGSSWDKGILYLTLLHSPGYTTHPLGDRPTLPSDRHADYMEQGERDFSFRLVAGAVGDHIAREALTFNEALMAVNIFPSGDGYDLRSVPPGRIPFLTLSQASPVLLTALKKREEGEGSLLRLFNPTSEETSVLVKCPTQELCRTLTLGAYEVATYGLKEGELIPCRMDERPL